MILSIDERQTRPCEVCIFNDDGWELCKCNRPEYRQRLIRIHELYKSGINETYNYKFSYRAAKEVPCVMNIRIAEVVALMNGLQSDKNE